MLFFGQSKRIRLNADRALYAAKHKGRDRPVSEKEIWETVR